VLFGDYLPDATMIERLCHAFLEPIFSTAHVNPDALSVLTSLRQMGLKTAVVSNTPWGSSGRAWRSDLARHGLLGALDAVVFCTDVGWRKPHPIPFRRALALLDAAPHEAVFVGDDPIWDIDGAHGAGLRPILLATHEHPDTAAPVTLVTSLPDVLLKVSQWNSATSAGPQPALV
jgi:putative hydrolase of the HAD superfamily